jgi:hypothetical protein
MAGEWKGPGRKSWVPPAERMVNKSIMLAPQQVAWLEEKSQSRAVTLSQVVRDAVAVAMAAEMDPEQAGERATRARVEEGLRRLEVLLVEAERLTAAQTAAITVNEQAQREFRLKLEAAKADLRRAPAAVLPMAPNSPQLAGQPLGGSEAVG